jgi:hypothetical protein
MQARDVFMHDAILVGRHEHAMAHKLRPTLKH